MFVSFRKMWLKFVGYVLN